MKVINGDILKLNSTGIICHQVNCRKTMGAGLANQIKYRYPEVYDEYMQTKPRLGKVLFTKCGDGRIIASLYAQDGYGRDKQYTDYDYLKECLLGVADFAKIVRRTVYLPYNIGCGLAGGDWNKVSTLIEECLSSIDYTVVKLGGTL